MGQLDLPVLLSYPQTDFTILTANGPQTFPHRPELYAFTALMFVLGIAWAFGKASVFNYISDDYGANIGTISGIVGLAGGLGGFCCPSLFGALMDLTGMRSSAFMLMYGVVWVSLDLDVLDRGYARPRSWAPTHQPRPWLRPLTPLTNPLATHRATAMTHYFCTGVFMKPCSIHTQRQRPTAHHWDPEDSAAWNARASTWPGAPWSSPR